VCDQFWSDRGDEACMLQCDGCDIWVHAKCERISADAVAVWHSLTYTCPECRGEKPGEGLPQQPQRAVAGPAVSASAANTDSNAASAFISAPVSESGGRVRDGGDGGGGGCFSCSTPCLAEYVAVPVHGEVGLCASCVTRWDRREYCPVCVKLWKQTEEEEAEEEMVQCDACSLWVHAACEYLAPSDVARLESCSYKCPACRNELPGAGIGIDRTPIPLAPPLSTMAKGSATTPLRTPRGQVAGPPASPATTVATPAAASVAKSSARTVSRMLTAQSGVVWHSPQEQRAATPQRLQRAQIHAQQLAWQLAGQQAQRNMHQLIQPVLSGRQPQSLQMPQAHQEQFQHQFQQGQQGQQFTQEQSRQGHEQSRQQQQMLQQQLTRQIQQPHTMARQMQQHPTQSAGHPSAWPHHAHSGWPGSPLPMPPFQWPHPSASTHPHMPARTTAVPTSVMANLTTVLATLLTQASDLPWVQVAPVPLLAPFTAAAAIPVAAAAPALTARAPAAALAATTAVDLTRERETAPSSVKAMPYDPALAARYSVHAEAFEPLTAENLAPKMTKLCEVYMYIYR